MKTIAVLGTGTAGISTIAQLLTNCSSEWQIVSIHDPNKPILGIGESTNVGPMVNLWWGAGFNMLEHAHELDATMKLGSKFINWRSEDFFLPLPAPLYAIHFNNFKLRECAMPKFKEKWDYKFQEIQGNVSSIINGNDSVHLTVNGVEYVFDYVIDCGGYPTDYSEYTMVDTIPVNHCLVNILEEPGNWNYTVSQAHKNGWMFKLPLSSRQGRGYLYNDNITSKEDALADMADILNIPVGQLKTKEFSWKTYKAKKFIDGRIIKNGNRALFYEPLEALAGWFYERVIRSFFDVAVTKEITEDQANNLLHDLAEDFELFICYMYHGGSKYDTDFWRITSAKTKNRLMNSEVFRENVKILKDITPQHYVRDCPVIPMPYNVWHYLDKKLGFNYFKKD